MGDVEHDILLTEAGGSNGPRIPPAVTRIEGDAPDRALALRGHDGRPRFETSSEIDHHAKRIGQIEDASVCGAGEIDDHPQTILALAEPDVLDEPLGFNRRLQPLLAADIVKIEIHPMAALRGGIGRQDAHVVAGRRGERQHDTATLLPAVGLHLRQAHWIGAHHVRGRHHDYVASLGALEQSRCWRRCAGAGAGAGARRRQLGASDGRRVLRGFAAPLRLQRQQGATTRTEDLEMTYEPVQTRHAVLPFVPILGHRDLAFERQEDLTVRLVAIGALLCDEQRAAKVRAA